MAIETSKVGDWIGEITPTTGTGELILSGAIAGYASFSDFGEGDYWYSIVDGNNRETGITTYNGLSLTRNNVHGTLVDGVYSSENIPISLSGSAKIYSTFSKTAFEFITNFVNKNNIDIGSALDTIRTFKMGFTVWPYDFNPPNTEAGPWTYNAVNANSDIVAHHMKDGIPWQDAYDDVATYDSAVESQISTRVGGTDPSKDVFLTIDSLEQNRRWLIGDFPNPSHDDPRPAPWDTRDFDDPEVITAYSNFAIYVINKFGNVTHFCYGAEVSELFTFEFIQAGQWDKYLTFAAGVYANLKAEFPNLKVMCSMILKTPGTAEAYAWRDQFARIANYTDVAGISVYPYAFFTPLTDVRPNELPSDWLAQVRAIAPGKPYAITETGWPAEDFNVVTPALVGTSTPEIQDQYMNLLMINALALDCEFVIWWCIADFDQGWVSTLQSIPAAAGALIWKDIGIYDGLLAPRDSYATWNSWLSKDVYQLPDGLIKGLNLEIAWSATVNNLISRGNIATDTLQVNNGIVGRSAFFLTSVTTANITANVLEVLEGFTLRGNLTGLANIQGVEIAATTLFSAPVIFITKPDGTGAGYFDTVVANGLLVTNDDNDAAAGIDIINTKSLNVSDGGTAVANIDNVSADDVTSNTGNIDTFETNNFTNTGQTFLNLPTSAGASGTLWNDAGTVRVVP